MDFLELAAKRYSVRKFREEKVRQEDLDKILKAGMLAPTAHNDQPQRILVINSDEALEKLKKCTACHFNAPTALLICSDKDACWTRKYDALLITPLTVVGATRTPAGRASTTAKRVTT